MRLKVYQFRDYIASIRNARKRAYAVAYLAWLRGQAASEPEYAPLSYMAAQAVRLTLNGIEAGTHSYPAA